jgi:hypothetical protein
VKPVDQTVFGPRGNCKAACVASVLEVALADVPECDGGVWVQRHMDWLAARNLTLLHIPANGGRFYVPGCHLLIAKSPRNDGYHCVVVRDGEIVHDPHPERHLGVGEWLTYGLFVALDPSGKVNVRQ